MSARVAVLLSTYNGEAFLKDQLDSLVAQQGVAVELLVRDDGSADRTREILASYADHWPALASLPKGPNLKPAKSFLALLAAAADDFDAYAFCDQDDVWLPHKLARAVDHLAQVPSGRPALYCSRVRLVDAHLRPQGDGPVKDNGRLEHLLFENIAFGVTVVMNAAAARLVRSRPPVDGVIMHDWWSALVVSAFGEVIYDLHPGVLYRQHGANEIGQASSTLSELVRQARIFLRGPRRYWPVWAQAAEFLRLWGEDLDPRQRALVASFVQSRASLGARLRYATTGKIVRSLPSGEFAARMLIAAGLY